MSYILGIDVGTSCSAAAVAEDGHAEICSLGDTAATIPSVLFLRDDGELLAGDAAQRRLLIDPSRASREFKRRLGDPTPVLLGDTPFAAEVLMSRLYREIHDAVAEERGDPPESVIVTHPAHFGPYKLDLLNQAVRMAGVLDARFISEAEAAAVHYAERERIEPGDVVAVYDLGGGTFDAAVLRRTADGYELIGEPEGIPHLGGVDFDQAVLSHVRGALEGRIDRLDSTDPVVLASAIRLRTECIGAKEALSTDDEAIIPVLFPTVQAEVRITRRQFEAMIRPRIGETISALERAVHSAGLTMADVTRVLLVGGSSRIPLIREAVAEATNRPVALDSHPKFAVAVGAVMMAAEEAAVAEMPRTIAPAMAAVPAAPPLELGEERRGARRPWPKANIAVALVAAGVLGVVLAHSGDGRGTPGSAKARSESALPGASSPRPLPSSGQPVLGSWRGLRDAPTARQQMGSAVLNGTLWVAGGLEGGGSTARVEGYDPAIDTWKLGPDLPLPLHHEMAVAFRDELVVLGGWVPDGPNLTAVTSDRVFALRRGVWVELPRLSRPRAAGAAAVVGDRIVVVGGQDSGALVPTVDVFDGVGWREGPALPTPREHLAAATDGRFLYAVGGRVLSADHNLGAVERFDPVEQRWSRLPDLPTPRGGLGAAVVGSRLVALGGEEPTGVYDVVEALDLGSGTWSSLSPMGVPRHGMAVGVLNNALYAIGGGRAPSHAQHSPTVEVLQLASPSSWRGLRDAPTARQQMGSAVLNGTLWVAGGLEGGGSTARVEGYDPAIDTWKLGPDLPLPLHHEMAVAFRDELVVLGGWVPDGPNLTAVTSDRVFALRRGVWVELPRLSRPRAAGAAAVVGDRIVVVGGQDSGALVPTVDVFDGVGWREGPALPTPREHLAAATDGRFLYAVGGRVLSADHNLGAVERFDPVEQRWSRLPDLPTPRGGLGAAVVGSRLVALGGEEPTGVYDVVEALDLGSGTWSSLSPMGVPRHGMAVGVLNNALYAIGGGRAPSHAQHSPTVEVLQLGP